ncbi:MAG: C10 family peptidase [Candidatus Delongbacteria bacterium]|nr:C10 family peptidase [Candidatus Delongbacteria bacterium]
MKSLISIILVLCVSLSAAFVDKDRAQKVAVNFYKNRCPEVTAKSGANVVKVIENVYMGEVTRYTVKFEQGFVIITSNDQLKPILAYSDHGTVPDPDKLGGQNFKEWIENYDRQLYCGKSSKYVDEAAVQQWIDIENNVFPKSYNIVVDRLVESKWDQIYPWNDQCPEKDNTWTYVGCIATTMAQMLNYHQWPVTGEGTVSYDWNGTTLSADFSTLNFDYSMMKDEIVIEWGLYPEYWESMNMNQSELDMLASLSYNMGLSVEMDYGTTADGGSGQTALGVADAFMDHWKAASSVFYSLGTPLLPEEDAALIRSELDAKRPWFWAGGLHAFLLDGYTSDYWYHFNFGWGGDYDGWFQRTFIIPGGVGSCDTGGGDFTASQIGITYVPLNDPFTAWPAPENFTGQLLNDSDVQLTWTKPSTGNPLSYNIYRSVDHTEQKLINNTISLSYSDLNLSAEDYAYSVKAVYSDGESHFTDTYYVQITEQEEYPIAENLSATPVGRTSIDIEWTKPYTGIIFFEEDFETGMTGWVQKQSVAAGVKSPSRDYFKDNIDGWMLVDYSTFNSDEYIHSGYNATGLSYSAGSNGNGPWSWNFTPEFTLSSNGFISFWIWYKNNETEGWLTNIRGYLYTGDFTEANTIQAEANLTNIFSWDGSVLGEAGNNLYDSEVFFDISAYTGTYRFGWAYEYTNGYQLAIDDVICGSNQGGTDEPTGYEIYRNNTLEATINDPEAIFWSDTNFADGDNEYFIRVLYPTGQSIPSDRVTAFIDANPKPDFLTGVFNDLSNDVELNWYMPYGTPPHWSAYIAPENCTTTVDYLDDTDCARRRVEFRAEELGLYYPVTIDSLAAGFYEWEDEPWNGNTFVIRLWEGHPIDGGVLQYESGTLTAISGEIYKIGLPMQVVVNGEWNVEVEALDVTTGHPSTLAGPSTSGINSYFYYTQESSYNYYVSSGGEPLTYCMIAHVTSGDPDPIVKSGWTAEKELVEKLPMIDNRVRKIADLKISGKGLDYYKIYRNDVIIGTSTTTSYTDNSLVYGTYTYYVTACYLNPVGESDGSNTVEVIGGIDPPGPFLNPVPSVLGNTLTISWDPLAEATGYNIYSSTDPYGTFTLEDSVVGTTWESTIMLDKKFFCITATNEMKEPMKEIRVKQPGLVK